MDEQQKQPKTERSRILVVYGYHIRENFAPEVVREVAKQNLPETRIVKYLGEPNDAEEEWRNWKTMDYRGLTLRRFVRTYMPFDYILDVHDSPRAVDLPHYTFPACGFFYKSKLVIPTRIRKALESYSQKQDKNFPGRYVARTFVDRWKDMSSKYDALSIELVPKYITKEQSVSYLSGLIKILSANPRRI